MMRISGSLCSFLMGIPVALCAGAPVLCENATLEAPGMKVQFLRSDAYAVQFDDGRICSDIRVEPRLRLRAGCFDPLKDGELALEAFRADASNQLFLIQLKTQAFEPFQKELAKRGAEILMPQADQGLIVKMDTATKEKISRLPFVRWIGDYHPQYKLDESILEAADRDEKTLKNYSILLFRVDEAMREAVLSRIDKLQGQVTNVQSLRIEAALNFAQVLEIARMSEVHFIDQAGVPQLYLNKVREISGQTYLESVKGYNGKGVRGEVCDGGILASHSDFAKKPPMSHGAVAAGVEHHGTACYGIIYGDGTGKANARGILSGGQGIFTTYSNYSKAGDRLTMTQELVDPNKAFKAVFQSNSWGQGVTKKFEYSTHAAELDNIIFTTDFLICQAMANHAGLKSIEYLAVAKNPISVGGITHGGSLDKTKHKWSNASIGPASDGRIKPELSHFFDMVHAPAYNFNGYYDNFSGTSCSTPIVAGYSGLFFQMWADGVFDGGPGKGRDVFASRPHYTMAKAMLINSAYSYPFSGLDHNLTRTHQGWGLPDLKNLYDIAKVNQWKLPVVVNEDKVLKPLETHTYNVKVSGNTYLKASMVYSDPKGSPGSAQARINALSLKVTSPTGTVYWGNNGLLEGNWSKPGGEDNKIDTAKNVFVEKAEKGDWTVQVIGTEIVQDAHPETSEIDADYALVVTTTNGGGGK